MVVMVVMMIMLLLVMMMAMVVTVMVVAIDLMSFPRNIDPECSALSNRYTRRASKTESISI
jgi:hypothetical protein